MNPDPFGSYARGYSGDVAASSAQRLKSDLIRRYVGPGSHVLDVGCGDGLHLSVAAEDAQLVCGLDVSLRMLEVASERCAHDSHVRFICSDASRLPFGDGTFDVVYAYSTLVLLPSVPEALGEISRVLRPGGTAILDVVGKYHLSAWYWRSWWRRRGQPYYATFARPEASSMIREAGLLPSEVLAAGLTDYWRYIPLLRRWSALSQMFNSGHPDRDLRWSNTRAFRGLASRWYIVATRVPVDGSGKRSGTVGH